MILDALPLTAANAVLLATGIDALLLDAFDAVLLVEALDAIPRDALLLLCLVLLVLCLVLLLPLFGLVVLVIPVVWPMTGGVAWAEHAALALPRSRLNGSRGQGGPRRCQAPPR